MVRGIHSSYKARSGGPVESEGWAHGVLAWPGRVGWTSKLEWGWRGRTQKLFRSALHQNQKTQPQHWADSFASSGRSPRNMPRGRAEPHSTLRLSTMLRPSQPSLQTTSRKQGQNIGPPRVPRCMNARSDTGSFACVAVESQLNITAEVLALTKKLCRAILCMPPFRPEAMFRSRTALLTNSNASCQKQFPPELSKSLTTTPIPPHRIE